jgi:hypothetical protein
MIHGQQNIKFINVCSSNHTSVPEKRQGLKFDTNEVPNPPAVTRCSRMVYFKVSNFPLNFGLVAKAQWDMPI